MSQLAIASDQRVTLHYVLYDEAGDVVDEASSQRPLSYVHGYVDVAPGLSQRLAGLAQGQHFDLTLSPGEAFGDHDERGIFEVERSSFPNPDQILVGDSFVAKGVTGDDIAMAVLEVYEDCVVVDTNHPLAGQTVRIEGDVFAVGPANEAEVSRARAASSAPPGPASIEGSSRPVEQSIE